MAAQCTICARPDRQEIDGRLLQGQSGDRVARELGLSVASVYRHIRSGHHEPQEAAPDSKLIAQMSRSLRQSEGVMRVALKHLKATALGSDPKATNGAISAAKSMLELISELRGDLQRGVRVQVNTTVETKEAMDARAAALALTRDEEIEAARALLAAHVEAGDRDAIAAVLALVRMVPDADATVPDGTGVVGGSSAATS